MGNLVRRGKKALPEGFLLTLSRKSGKLSSWQNRKLCVDISLIVECFCFVSSVILISDEKVVRIMMVRS